jgi:hypothetical protein
MRIIFTVLLLTACSPDAAEAPAEHLLYAGESRDRLCVAGQRGGLIIYGAGDTNCSARGHVDRSGDRLTLIPDGDPDCRIEATLAGDTLRLGARSPSCAYYCGPGADFADKALAKDAAASLAKDFAGDPLC